MNETRTKLDNTILKQAGCTEVKKRFLSNMEELNATRTELKGTVLAFDGTIMELKESALEIGEIKTRLS